MLSNNANYHMEDAINEIEQLQLILDSKIDSQVILQILVQKGIVTREEVAEMRKKVSSSPKYKASIDYLENANKQAQYYKDNPQEHLKDLFNAKMNGTIR